MKFKNKKFAYQTFANHLYTYICNDLAKNYPSRNLILIPIPMHFYAKWNRGYNQTESLCKEIIKYDKLETFIYIPNVIKKIKFTKSQKHLDNKDQRLQNLKDSFYIKNKSVVSGKIVVVIDDVWTTGATLHEITKILKQSGAEKVFCYAIAH